MREGEGSGAEGEFAYEESRVGSWADRSGLVVAQAGEGDNGSVGADVGPGGGLGGGGRRGGGGVSRGGGGGGSSGLMSIRLSMSI